MAAASKVENPQDYIIEEGEVSFLYRPKEGVDSIRSDEDVAEFYIIQVPKRQGAKCRLLVTAKHRLPDVNHPGEERTVGLVARVADSASAIRHALDSVSFHSTPAREAGKGMYALVGKGLPETYILHELVDPPQPGPEQKALTLAQVDGKCACFKIIVKNPNQRPAPSIGEHAPPDFVTKAPSKLEYFDGRKYAQVHDPSLLDYERVESVSSPILPVKRKLPGDLRAAIAAHMEEQAKEQGMGTKASSFDDEQEEVSGFVSPRRWLR